jgi:hypothetical protein
MKGRDGFHQIFGEIDGANGLIECYGCMVVGDFDENFAIALEFFVSKISTVVDLAAFALDNLVGSMVFSMGTAILEEFVVGRKLPNNALLSEPSPLLGVESGQIDFIP